MEKGWFYNARTVYWTALNPGNRFGIIYNMKSNNIGIEGGKAGFIARVNAKCGDMLTPAIFEEIKNGVFRSEEYKEKIMPFLIEELGLTPEEFYSTEKYRPGKAAKAKAVAEVKVQNVPITKPAPTEVFIQGKTEAPVPKPKPAPVTGQSDKPKLCIDNHMEEGLIVVLKEEDGVLVLHIYSSDGENMKKSGSEWVYPVDIIANGYDTRVRRKELYKAVKVVKK
jgi:hypothetical protein